MESGLTIGGVIAVIGLSFIASPALAYELETIAGKQKPRTHTRGFWTRIARSGGGGELIPVVTQGKTRSPEFRSCSAFKNACHICPDFRNEH